MKQKYITKSMVISGILCLVGIVICSFLFKSATNAAKDNEINKDPVVVNYQNTDNVIPLSTNTSIPDGYVKANYTVEDDVMFSYLLDSIVPISTEIPSKYDLTRAEAAEQGAQILWELFGVDATDMVIKMYYQSNKNTPLSSEWNGCVESKDKSGKKYGFELDSITGEILYAQIYREEIDVYPPIKPMVESEYYKIAEDYVKTHNLIAGEIAKSENTTLLGFEEIPELAQSPAFNSVVYVSVTGVNGEEADIVITRPDKKVIGVTSDKEIKFNATNS